MRTAHAIAKAWASPNKMVPGQYTMRRIILMCVGIALTLLASTSTRTAPHASQCQCEPRDYAEAQPEAGLAERSIRAAAAAYANQVSKIEFPPEAREDAFDGEIESVTPGLDAFQEEMSAFV